MKWPNIGFTVDVELMPGLAVGLVYTRDGQLIVLLGILVLTFAPIEYL